MVAYNICVVEVSRGDRVRAVNTIGLHPVRLSET
jgi:hypothetical protein